MVGRGAGKRVGAAQGGLVTLGLSCLSCTGAKPSSRPGLGNVRLEEFRSRWQVVEGEIHRHELLGFRDQEFGGGRRGMCG